MTQIIMAIQAALIALNGFLVADQLDEVLSNEAQIVLSVVVAVVLAGLGPFLPKVSETIRRTMNLQRRG